LGLLLLLVLAFSIQAHDLWVASTDDGYVVMRGHLPDRSDPYDPECIQTLAAFDEKGLPLPLKRLDREQRVLVEPLSSPALVAVVSKWGHRIIDGDGRKRFMSKAEALESGAVVREAFFSTQYSKTLFRFNERFAKPLGMKFEVVPQKSPFGLHEGDLLPVQVLFDGAPLLKGKIERGRQMAPLETDRHGMAQIPIQTKGWQKILVVHDTPATETQDVDYYRHFAFLVFEVQ
jgi:hypothetical protein